MIPFFIWEDKNLKKIDLMTITALQIKRNYTNVYFSDATFSMVRVSLKNALKLLPADMFIRVSRNCAVSIYFIKEIRMDEVIIQDRSVKVDQDRSVTVDQDRSVKVDKGYFDLIKTQIKILGNKDYDGNSQDEQNPNDDPDQENEDDDDE